MAHHIRKYTPGSVAPYARTKDSKPRWRATIREGIVTETTNKLGHAILEENGCPKLTTKWRTLTRVFPDIDCAPYKSRGAIRHRGQREAERALQNWREELEDRARADHEAAIARDEREARAVTFKYDSMLVPDYLNLYEEELRADGKQPSTIDGYHFATSSVRKFFSDVTVGELDEEALKSYDRHYRGDGLSDTTRGKALRILRQALSAHRKQLGSDPFEDFSIPAPNGPDPNPLTTESLDAVRAAVRMSDPTQFMCAVEMALRTGMRIGEICGLRWRDVDMETGDVYVCNAIARTRGGASCYEKAPKSNDRRRNTSRHVPGSPKIAAMFNRRFEYMVEEVKRIHVGMPDAEAREAVSGTLYVVGPATGGFANPAVLGRTWKGYSQPFKGTKGRRPTFHDLRHTYATQAIAKGIDPVTVASILGHSDPKLTMTVYADAMPEVKVKAQLQMDEVF